MKVFCGKIIVLFLFSINLFASDLDFSKSQTKIYFNIDDLVISDHSLYFDLEDNIIEARAIRNDQQGFYIFENDIINYGIERPQKWKCPYCYYFWPIGQKCQNPNCPTNQW